MVTICFTPRLFLGFKNLRADVFNQLNLNRLPLLRAGLILYNTLIITGPMNNIAEIKVILNEKFNLYQTVNNHVNEQLWSTEFRGATIHEISEAYDTAVVAIHYLTSDIFQMVHRGFPHPPILQDISIQDNIGYLYV